jgi:hypothetical protein
LIEWSSTNAVIVRHRGYNADQCRDQQTYRDPKQHGGSSASSLLLAGRRSLKPGFLCRTSCEVRNRPRRPTKKPGCLLLLMVTAQSFSSGPPGCTAPCDLGRSTRSQASRTA